MSNVRPLVRSAVLTFISIAAVAVACGTARAGEELGAAGVSSEELAQFARRLQAAVAVHEPAAVAELVAFPLRVGQPRHKPKRLTKARFIATFNAVFTPEVTAVVAAQDPQALFQSSKGVMFGNGEVWVAGVCSTSRCTKSKLLVVAVNLPGK